MQDAVACRGRSAAEEDGRGWEAAACLFVPDLLLLPDACCRLRSCCCCCCWCAAARVCCFCVVLNLCATAARVGRSCVLFLCDCVLRAPCCLLLQEEGVVVKLLDAVWKPDDRSGSWLKLKPDYMTDLEVR